MADIGRLVKQSKREVKMRPVLPLGLALPLGAVGFLENDAFRYWGSVETMLGVPPGPAMTGATVPLVELQSGRDVKLSTLAKGSTSETFGELAKGKARIEISLGSEHSYVMAAREVTVKTLQEPHRLAVPMLRAYHEGMWDPAHVIVYEIGVAAGFSAILAHQSDTKVLVSAGADVGSGPAKIGDLAGKVQFESSSRTLIKLIGAKNTIAFFNAYKVHLDWLNNATIRTAAVAIPPSTPPARQSEEIELPAKLFQRV